MNMAGGDGAFVLAWLAMTGLMLAGSLTLLVWGVRHNQFRRQDRARYLPLWSDVPRAAPSTPRSNPPSAPPAKRLYSFRGRAFPPGQPLRKRQPRRKP